MHNRPVTLHVKNCLYAPRLGVHAWTDFFFFFDDYAWTDGPWQLLARLRQLRFGH